MNVDFKITQSIDIQNILGYNDGYRIKGFLVMMISWQLRRSH